jgi:hypothetical protein
MVESKSCLTCKHYSMEGGEERGRTSLDFCSRKAEYLPTAAFSFNDVCCSGANLCFSAQAFSCLEEIAQECSYYEKKDV